MKMRGVFTGVFIALAVTAFSLEAYGAVASDRVEDHDHLRKLRETAAQALSARDADLFKTILYSPFVFTTVDGTVIRSMDDFSSYVNRLFNVSNAPLKDIRFNPESDGPTEFLSENVGVNHGYSKDVYTFSNGKVKTMDARWTSVVIKTEGGWKIAAIHLSSNILDNPIINTLKGKLMLFCGGGLLLGFVLGFIARVLTGKK